MNTKEVDQLTKIAFGCAKYSFSIGTVIFMAYCISRFEFLTIAGAVFTMISAFVNGLLLFSLFILLLIHPKHYLLILKTTVILLMNIPAALLYLWIFTQLPHS